MSLKNKPNLFVVKNRLWILGKQGTFLGEGRIRLLKKINENGSISKAALEMHMSYKKAWELIDAMNKEASKDLVIRVSGGSGGGGTILTEYGKNTIETFELFTEKCNQIINYEFSKIEF